MEREISRRRFSREELLLQSVRRISRTPLDSDLWGVAAAIARAGVELVDAHQGSLGLVDLESGEVFTAASLELPRPSQQARFGPQEGVAGWVAATRRGALINDVRKDPRYIRLRYPSVRSFISVPMQVNGDLVGVLSCGAWESNAFGEVELAMLSTLADHAAVTIKVAQQLHISREQSKRDATFFMDAVHELKGPVHSIRGSLDILLNEQLGPISQQQREFLDIAREASQRLGDSIAGLLEMGAAGRRPRLGLQTARAEDLIAEVIGRLRASIELHRIQVRSDVSPSVPPVQVDRAAIQQVLVNLLANALKVSPSGSTVVLRVHQQGDEVTFSVTDSGPGLPPEEREHVFSRYYQADPAARAPGEVGLGLALCRDIIERHGGHIWAEDAETGGARLSFALPLYVRRGL